jgi:hypothetical protein
MRSAHMAGVTTAPNDAYLKQVARNLTGVGYGLLLNCWYLIMGAIKNSQMISEGIWTSAYHASQAFAGQVRIAYVLRPESNGP